MIRARQTHGAPPPIQPQYGYGYGAVSTPLSPQLANPTATLLAQALATQQQPGGNSNLMNLISSLDARTLQKLIATLQQQQQQQPSPLGPPQVQQYPQSVQQSQPQPQITPDLAALLAGRGTPQAQPGFGTAGLNIASLYGQPQQMQQAPQQQQQPQLQNILETLGRYKH